MDKLKKINTTEECYYVVRAKYSAVSFYDVKVEEIKCSEKLSSIKKAIDWINKNKYLLYVGGHGMNDYLPMVKCSIIETKGIKNVYSYKL